MAEQISEELTFGTLCAGIFAIGAVAVWILLIVYVAGLFVWNTIALVVPM